MRSFGIIRIRISDPRSLRSWQIKWTAESTLGKDSSVLLIYHDPSDLRSLILIRIIQKERTLYVYTLPRGGSRIFLGGGALVSFSTSTPINHIVFFFLQNTSCIRKSQVISGRGGAHPLHPPPRSAPDNDDVVDMMIMISGRMSSKLILCHYSFQKTTAIHD